MSRKWNRVSKKSERVFTKPMWKKVSDLKNTDFVGLPIIDFEENPRNLNEEKCWLLGRYIADGYYQDSKRKNRKNSYTYKVIICVGKKKADVFEDKICTLKYTKLEQRTCFKIS